MTDTHGRAPPEKVAAALVSGLGQRRDFNNGSDSQKNTTTEHAAEAGSTLDTAQLMQMAVALKPRGELRRHLPKHPAWCRRIGDDVWFSLMMQRQPDPSEIPLLLDAHGRAMARRDHEQEVAEKERELRALAQRLMRGERIPATPAVDDSAGSAK